LLARDARARLRPAAGRRLARADAWRRGRARAVAAALGPRALHAAGARAGARLARAARRARTPAAAASVRARARRPEVSAGMRCLLFGTERYAIPILAPLAAELEARGGRAAWCLPGVSAQLAPQGERLEHARAVRRYAPDAVLCAANVVPPFLPGLK